MGIGWIHFHDDNFLLDKDRVRELCHRIIEDRINFQWTCLANVETISKHPEILGLMKRAGCIGIEMGIESGDMAVLKKLNKNQSLENIKKAVKSIRENNIMVMYLMMEYNISENIDTSYRSMRLLYEMTFGPLETDQIPEFVHDKMLLMGHLVRASPGCEFYDEAEKNGRVLTKTWDDHFEENICFLPNSLLHDIPIKLRRFSEEEVLAFIEKNEKNILFYIDSCFYTSRIIINENFEKITDFYKIMQKLYLECDGVKTVEQVISGQDIKSAASALSMLSLIRLIGSK